MTTTPLTETGVTGTTNQPADRAERLETVVALPLPAAKERVEAALRQAGFGILTDIDVAGVLHQKLGADHQPLEILGACNPSLAHRALLADPDAALLLPCNVVLREEEPGRTTVTFADPRQLLPGTAGVEVAAEAATLLTQALDELRR
jgi:uncharacterized protein (DUF302 family)